MMGLAALFLFAPRAVDAADGRTGEQIYKEQCASCHGKQGEGSKDYGHPLEGDKSVGQLAKFIAKTMPEDDPGTCVGEDAEKVAAYIHEAFYSKAAQARNRPAADRALAADRPAVPQRGRRPDRQLPHARRVGRQARAAGRVLQVAADAAATASA